MMYRLLMCNHDLRDRLARPDADTVVAEAMVNEVCMDRRKKNVVSVASDTTTLTSVNSRHVTHPSYFDLVRLQVHVEEETTTKTLERRAIRLCVLGCTLTYSRTIASSV